MPLEPAPTAHETAREPAGLARFFTSRAERASLLLLLGAYAFVQARGLFSPGLIGEEAAEGVSAQTIIALGPRNARFWPIVMGGYHGNLQAYLLAPFLLLGSRPEASLRLAEVFSGLVVILATYLCARRFFTPLAAACALVFLLPNPCFVYMSRVALPHAEIMAAFYLGALVCLEDWLRGATDRRLFAAAFLIGAGASVRLWFFWFPAALLLALLSTERRRTILRASAPGGPGRAAGLVLALLLGGAPLILKDLTASGITTYAAVASNFPVTVCDVDNLAVVHNLALNARQLAEMLAGYIKDFFPPYPPALGGAVEAAAEAYHGLLLAFSALCVLLLARGETLRRGAFFLVLLLGMFLCALFTVSNYRQDHLFILFPLPQIVMGLAASLLLERLASSPRAAGAALLALALSPSFHLWTLAREESHLRATGGTGQATDATFELAGWLDANGYRAPKACDAGPVVPLRFLSRGRIRAVPCWMDAPPPSGRMDAEQKADFMSRCVGGENLYLFLAPARSLDFAAISSAVGEIGGTFVPIRAFLARDGQAALVAYALRRGPAAADGAGIIRHAIER